MAISIKNREVINYNQPGADGKPKNDKYLDFIDDSTGEAAATLNIPASGDPPFFAVDGRPLVVYAKSITLTDAQIKALPSTPVEVLATVSGKVIRPVGGDLAMNWVAPYTNVATDNGYFQINESSGAVVLVGPVTDSGLSIDDLSALMGGYGAGFEKILCPLLLFGNAGDGYAVPAAYSGATWPTGGLVTDVGNGGLGNFTGGDAANTLTITVYYTLMDEPA